MVILRKNKIIIFRTRRPPVENINEELRWFCDSIGILGERDKDKSCFRMFVLLLRSLHDTDGLSSDDISEKVGLSRGTVVHHLHRLMGSGLVVFTGSRYMLRVSSLSSLVEELERDLLKTMSELKKAAEDIDKRLEL